MKIDELELYKALKVLSESGYLVSSDILNENRTFDVEDLVDKYKTRIMKLLKQRLIQMLDKVYDGQEVEKTITINIPELMVPVTYRKEPVKMKALTVKLYSRRTDVRKDYDAQKGRGKGTLYANAMGDTNPDSDPVILMINLPNVISTETAKSNRTAKAAKPAKKMTEGKYTSKITNTIPFPKTEKETKDNQDEVDQILTRLYQSRTKNATKTATKKTASDANGRTAERDALYARFASRYGMGNGGTGYYYTGGNYGSGYGGYYTQVDDSFKFKDAVKEAEGEAETPMQVVDKIMTKYFGSFFQEVLHHELTHYIQSNNKELDGTEDAHEYDAHAVIASGAYNSDELEYEAKLHQKLPAYIDAIQRATKVTPIAKKIVTQLFSNKFKDLPAEKQHKYFKEILTLCQVLKAHPEITRHNFNTLRVKKLLRDAL